MSAQETLEQFKVQAETELRALERKCDRLNQESKDLRSEVYKLHGTLNETVRAANLYADEMSEKLRAATDETCKQKALYCKARDELERTAAELKSLVPQLDVPIKVLDDWGFDFDGTNPLKAARDVQTFLRRKVQALSNFGGQRV